MSEYRIRFTTPYQRKEAQFLETHSEVRRQYAKTIQLLESNPYHPSLRLHKLQGHLRDVHSVSINMKYRITIEFIIQDKIIIPVMIGSHDEAYR
jgi:mRNA-degrading endonuclease YafQ of YafQ-DinJ toxin-antitoxin module